MTCSKSQRKWVVELTLKAQVHEIPKFFPLHHLISLTISEVVRVDMRTLLYGGICELARMWSVTAFWFTTQWWERTVLQTESENRIWTKPLSLEESGSNQIMWKERWAWETLSYYSLMISPKQSWRQLTMDFRIIHLERDNTYCTKVYFHLKCKLPCYIGFWFIIIFISHTECFIKVPAGKKKKKVLVRSHYSLFDRSSSWESMDK